MSSVVWQKKLATVIVGLFSLKENAPTKNKTGTSKVGAISKAQEAQSFLNMLIGRIHEKLWKHFRDTQSVPFMLDMTGKSLFPDWEQNKIWFFFWKFFWKKTSEMSHSAEKWKGGTLWDSLTYILLQNIKKLEGGTLLRP